MGQSQRSSARLLTAIVILAAILGIGAQRVSAADTEPGTGLWMAASGPEPSISGTNWGRLILKDGVLTFHASNNEWQLAVSDIKHVAISDVSDQIFEVESYSGERYYVAILGPNLLVDSPRRALQVIQRARRVTTARHE
jgi:hypothetical protein